MCCNFLSPCQKNLEAKKKNAPRETGAFAALFLAKSEAAGAASEGSLAYGFSADYSGGTAADFHSLPRCPCLQIEI
jgi:hypothetical protein